MGMYKNAHFTESGGCAGADNLGAIPETQVPVCDAGECVFNGE
jgi:hypothetical protein